MTKAASHSLNDGRREYQNVYRSDCNGHSRLALGLSYGCQVQLRFSAAPTPLWTHLGRSNVRTGLHNIVMPFSLWKFRSRKRRPLSSAQAHQPPKTWTLIRCQPPTLSIFPQLLDNSGQHMVFSWQDRRKWHASRVNILWKVLAEVPKIRWHILFLRVSLKINALHIDLR